MSKRTRTLETLGSLPYSTIDGGKWLKKALDPADIDVEVNGLPDTSTNPCCVLNYQFQGDIPIPHSTTFVPNTTQSYDVDFYCFQNPVTLGMSVSRPSGTKNPVGVSINVDKSNWIMHIPPGYSLGTVQLFENPQIEGDTKDEKLNSLERYCQRHRMVYGGVQCIPACSALFDSGTIEATQQIFSPEIKNINDCRVIKDTGQVDSDNRKIYKYASDDKVHLCQRFEPNDFPDEGSSIQNATALYCRYKEGIYMPYKIRNPLLHDYKGSEQRIYTEAPYVVTDYVVTRYAYSTTNFAPASTDYRALQATLDPESNSIKLMQVDPSSQNAAYYRVDEVYILCYSKTGVPFYICIDWKKCPTNITLPAILPVYNTINIDDTNGIVQATHQPVYGNLGDLNYGDINYNPYYYTIIGGKFTTVDMGRANNETMVDKNYAVSDIPTREANVGIICFRSIGLQASIRVIFRFGLEMMITAGGVYTPFKHKAPKYDQKALNSYIRSVHNMRDAFLGNAATPEGHALYAAHIAAIAADEGGTYVSNQGSRWYGAVSV